MTKISASRWRTAATSAAGPLLVFCTLTGVLTRQAAYADWRPTGPFGGDAELVRAVPKSRGFVIAGAHNGLLFSSTNGGASWSNLPFDGQLTGVLHALEVDPRSTGTWYAGMEGDHPWTSGVYKTVDAGQSWKLLPGTQGKAVWALALWPTNPDVIAAGTGDGVYRSLNGGESWAQISEPDNSEFRPVVSLAFHPSDRDIIYAGTTHLPWRTTDGGKSWESIHTGMIDDSDVFSIQVDAHQPASVYASACSGLYQSSDSAGHWNKLPTPKGAFRTWFVALDPRHSNIVFAGTTEGLLRSEDGGKIWRVVSTEAVRSIAFDPFVPERVFFASTTNGMMVSTDGGRTLRDSNFGFSNRSFTALAGAHGVLYLNSVFEGSGGVYRTENFGLRWQRAGGEPAGQEIRLMTAAPDQPGTLFAAGYHGLLQSKDFGKTWTEKAIPSGAEQLSSLLALPHNTLLAATAQGLYRSVEGAGWQMAGGVPGGVSSLELSGKQTIAAVSGRGAFASTDAGVTWRTCGEPAPATVWYGLAFDAGKTHTALAATSAGLFRSTDDCGTWTRSGGDLAAATVSTVLFHPTRAGEAFVSQDGRIFRSIDEGQHWLPLDDDTGSKVWPVALVVLPELPDRLYALFPRRGVSFDAFDPRRVEVAQFNHFAAPKL
jgi:photosystem II stability/assembly factor-like uncharacterized protein